MIDTFCVCGLFRCWQSFYWLARSLSLIQIFDWQPTESIMRVQASVVDSAFVLSTSISLICETMRLHSQQLKRPNGAAAPRSLVTQSRIRILHVNRSFTDMLHVRTSILLRSLRTWPPLERLQDINMKSSLGVHSTQ